MKILTFFRNLTLTIGLLFIVNIANGATTYYSRASANWAVASTWSTVSFGGTPASAYPVAGDIVNIGGGFTVTVDVASACASIQFGQASAASAGSLTFSNSSTLTVSGAVTVGNNISGSSGTITFTNGSTLSAGSLLLGGSVAGANGTITMTAGGTLSLGGAITLGANSTKTWTPGAGTVIFTGTSTLPSSIFTTFNNLQINGGTTTTGVSITAIASLTIGGSGTFTTAATHAITATNVTINGTYTNGSTGAMTFTNWVVGSTGSYNHNSNAAAFPIGSTTSTWDAASNFNINGLTGAVNTTNFIGQSFGKVTYNCTGQTGAVDLCPANGTVTIKGNFTISSSGTGTLYFRLSGQIFTPIINILGNFTMSGGTLDLNNDGGTGLPSTVNLSGNFTMSGGTLMQSTSVANATSSFNFVGGVTQTFSKTGGTISSTANAGNAIVFNVTNNSILDMGTSVMDGTGATAFNLSSGAGIITANTGGLSSTGATGSIQVAGTRTYSTGANYTYNGSLAQVTGTGLPASVNDLTISNSAGVTFSAAETINGTLAISTGAVANLGTFTSHAVFLSLGGANQSTPASYGGTGAGGGATINTTFFSAATGYVTAGVIPPSNLSYISPNTFTPNVPITQLNPTVTGTVTSYSVSPSLPAGLSFSTSSGAITGTPTTSTATATYTVTATNGGGSTSFGVVITVGTAITSIKSGLWSAISTWSTNSLPTEGDNVTILSNNNVTVDIISAVCNTLSIAPTNNNIAAVTFNINTKLTVSGIVTLGNSGNTNRRGALTMASGGILVCKGLALANTGTNTFTPGTGTVELTASNTLPATIFTSFNKLTVSGGTTTLGANLNSVAAGTVTVKAGATLALSTFTYGATTPPAGLAMEYGSTGASLTGTGALTLGGDVSVTGSTGNNGASISCPLALGSSNRTFTIADDGTSAADLSINSVISGTGGIIKAGVGTMVLAGNNNFTGVMSITAGILKLGGTGSGAATPLGQSGSGVTVTSGSLDLAGYTLSAFLPITINGTGVSNGGAIMNSGGAATYGGLITLGSASSIVGGTGSINISNAGTITGSGFGLILGGAQGGTLASILGTGTGTLTKADAGTWTISGASTYTGTTTVSAGTLKLGSAGTGTNTPLGTSAAGTSVTSGATLDLNGFTLVTSEGFTLNGAGASSAGALANGSATTAVTCNGTVTLGSAATINTTSNISVVTMTGGGNDLTKAGAATLSLGSNAVSLGSLIISTGTLTSTSGSMTLTGNFSNSGTFTHNSGTVTFSGNTTQSITGTNTFNNLTTSKTASGKGVSATAASTGQTITGVLNLGDYNHSGTVGSLDMGSNTLTMESLATTTGTADVTGTVTRTSITLGTSYSFGNQYTTISFASNGGTPSSVSMNISIGAAPSRQTTAVQRNYTLTYTSSSTPHPTISLHYLTGEMQSNTENLLTPWSYISSTLTERLRSDFNTTNKFVTFDASSYVASGDQFTLATMSSPNTLIWVGGIDTDWNKNTNWYNNHAIPTSTDNVIIPPGVTHNPSLPASTPTPAVAATINLQSGATLNAVSGAQLTLSGSAGAWNNDGGTFIPGSSSSTSRVVFTGTTPTISGTTNFYNVTINSGTRLEMQSGSYMGIIGNVTINGTGGTRGVWSTTSQGVTTVEYKGDVDQNVVIPDASTNRYYNLILSGSTNKTFDAPLSGSFLNIDGDFTNDCSYAFSAGPVNFISIGGTSQTLGGSHKTSFTDLQISNNTGGVIVNTNTDVSGTLTMNGTGTVLSPGADVVFNSVTAAGTLIGTGTIQVTKIANGADLDTQYKFATYTLDNATVEYIGTAAQILCDVISRTLSGLQDPAMS